MHNKSTQKRFEQYLDVAAELIMSRCDDAITRNVNQKVRKMEEDISFPEDLDRRCRELIRKEQTHIRRKHIGRAVCRAGRVAAIFMIGILLLSGVLFATVEAMRIPILDLLVEKTPSHWSFSGYREAEEDIPRDVIDPADPLGPFLPEGFSLVEAEGDTVGKLCGAYENAEGDYIRIRSLPKEEQPAPDWDGSESLNLCRINHYDVTLAVKGREITVFWYQEEMDCCFTITASGLSKDQVVATTELVISCLV